MANFRQISAEIKSLLESAAVLLADDDVPSIKHVARPFSHFLDSLAQASGNADEVEVYELLHVLFDDFEDEFTAGLSRQQQQEFQHRVRKDRLSQFVSKAVWRRHSSQIQAASKQSAVAAAILYLTAHDVRRACELLMQEKNFNLSLLVAQVAESDSDIQEGLAAQISHWRDQNVLSELSEEIRTLYEILSGNTTIAQGKQNVPAEDRATTFAISERFDLDWIQAFALCLWYGKHKHGDISDVVADFQDKLNTNEESASPVDGNGNEDPLWVVLKISASSKAKGKSRSRVEKPVLPQALSALSQPFVSKKVFRLHNIISAAIPDISIDRAAADDLAMSTAFEASARENVAGAAYALLHLADAAKRAACLRNLLDCHAAGLSVTSPPSLLWTALTIEFQIPASWIYQSKALYARACQEPLAELHYMILAGNFVDAHNCLLQRVAPGLVIDGDWETLKAVLTKFGDDAAQKVDSAVAAAGRDLSTEWKIGGQVYADFVELMTLTDPASTGKRDSVQGNQQLKEKNALIHRLQDGLSGFTARINNGAARLDLNKDRERLEERVAVWEMGKVVARSIEMEHGTGFGDKVCSNAQPGPTST
jgi:nuclear pore complex protein Nup98-Nup96